MIWIGLLMSHAAAAENYIHWVDFDVPVEALETAMRLDIESQGKEKSLDWVDILALGAARNGSGKLSAAQVQKAAIELEGDLPSSCWAHRQSIFATTGRPMGRYWTVWWAAMPSGRRTEAGRRNTA